MQCPQVDIIKYQLDFVRQLGIIRPIANLCHDFLAISCTPKTPAVAEAFFKIKKYFFAPLPALRTLGFFFACSNASI